MSSGIPASIFRQYDIRGVVGPELTPEVAQAIGRAFALYLDDQKVLGAVGVGRDNRPSGEALRDALCEGLNGAGRDVVDFGVVPTPLVYWSLHNVDGVTGGIQITGSHNPPEFNGFKLSVGPASLHGAEIQKLYRLISATPKPRRRGAVRHEEIVDRYIEDIARKIGPLKRRPKIAYDCGNGAAALVAPQLFKALGLEARGLFTESDGTFPNHHPDPTVPENLEDLIAAVKEDGAEFGVAFDGDADRIGLVDDKGNIIWGDRILIIYALDVLARTGQGQSIIFDVKCSQALPDAIAKAGGKPVMWKTGHSLIKDKMKELGAPVAGEMSGHMFFKEGFYGHDDALYGAARLIKICANGGKTVREILAPIPDFVSTPEIRIDVPEDKKFEIVARAVEHFKSKHETIDVDGVRVLYGDGWGLIRASNTQAILVARYEAATQKRLDEIRSEMEGWLRAQGVKV
jgi:phosphomannomutase/phosphoglucomutase